MHSQKARSFTQDIPKPVSVVPQHVYGAGELIPQLKFDSRDRIAIFVSLPV